MFIETDRDWINSDQVVTARLHRNCDTLVFYDREGLALGEVKSISPRQTADLLAPMYTVVPAAKGSSVLVIEAYHEPGDARPKDVAVERVPIVAWRVAPHENVARPVFPESWERENYLYEMPDGRLERPGMESYDNLTAAKEWVLKDAQQEWDKTHPQPARD